MESQEITVQVQRALQSVVVSVSAKLKANLLLVLMLPKD